MTDAASPPRLTPKGRATRERIVATAAALIYARGAGATSTDEVQTAAGVSASQLYHYFGDKRTLVRAVIAHQTDAVLKAQEPYLGRLDSLAGLRAWRDFVVDVARANDCAGGCPIGSLASELAESEAETRADLANGFRRWEAVLHAGLRRMQERGELAPEADPDRLALALLAAVQGGLLLSQTQRRTAPLEAALDTVLDQIAALAAATPA
jgi:AcrR family transcriptional regulator